MKLTGMCGDVIHRYYLYLVYTTMRCLVNSVQIEIEKQKGSRFIAFAFPIDGSSAIEARMEEVRQQHPKSKHLCYAWRTEDGQCGTSDGGEPKGSAGAPILQPITGEDLVNVLVVVVRYFGGVKLGIGGLVRAYGLACKTVLKECEFEKLIPRVIVEFCYSYDQESSVRRVISQFPNSESDFRYNAQVQVRLYLESALKERFFKEMDDATNGTVQCQIEEG